MVVKLLCVLCAWCIKLFSSVLWHCCLGASSSVVLFQTMWKKAKRQPAAISGLLGKQLLKQKYCNEWNSYLLVLYHTANVRSQRQSHKCFSSLSVSLPWLCSSSQRFVWRSLFCRSIVSSQNMMPIGHVLQYCWSVWAVKIASRTETVEEPKLLKMSKLCLYCFITASKLWWFPKDLGPVDLQNFEFLFWNCYQI